MACTDMHSDQKVDALIEAKMGSGFGGAQTRKRPTVMITGCLGPYPPTRLVSGVLTDVKLKEGGTQYMVFQADDLPPWYALNTPKEDTATGLTVPGEKEEDKDRNQNSAAHDRRPSSVTGGGRGGGARHGGRVRRQGQRTQIRAP